MQAIKKVAAIKRASRAKMKNGINKKNGSNQNCKSSQDKKKLTSSDYLRETGEIWVMTTFEVTQSEIFLFRRQTGKFAAFQFGLILGCQ